MCLSGQRVSALSWRTLTWFDGPFGYQVAYLGLFFEVNATMFHVYTDRPLLITALLLDDRIWEDKPFPSELAICVTFDQGSSLTLGITSVTFSVSPCFWATWKWLSSSVVLPAYAPADPNVNGHGYAGATLDLYTYVCLCASFCSLHTQHCVQEVISGKCLHILCLDWFDSEYISCDSLSMFLVSCSHLVRDYVV